MQYHTILINITQFHFIGEASHPFAERHFSYHRHQLNLCDHKMAHYNIQNLLTIRHFPNSKKLAPSNLIIIWG